MNKKLKVRSKYKCRISIREEYKGRRIRDNLESLNGTELVLEVMWLQDSEDKYPNEYAMGDNFKLLDERLYTLSDEKLVWVSSGDVIILEEL